MWRALGVIGLLGLAAGGYVAGVPAVQGALPASPITLGLVLVIVCMLVRPNGERVPAWEVLRAVAPLLLLAGGFAFVVLSDTGTEKALQMGTLVPVSIMGGVVLLQHHRARALWCLGTVGVGALVAGLLLLAPDALVADSDRLSIEGSNTIAAGRALGAAVVVLAALGLSGARRPVLLVAAATGFGAVMLATGSRGPLVACALAVAVVVLTGSGVPRARRAVAVVVAAGGAWWWAAAQGFYVDRLVGFQDASAQVRLVLYRIAADHAAASPLGTGFGSFEQVYLSAGLYYTYPHNLLLEAAGEAGVLGLAGVVWLLVRAWVRQYRRAATPVEVAMLALLVFFVVSAMVSGDLPSHRALWVMVGACTVSWLRGNPPAPEITPRRARGSAAAVR